MSDVTRPKPDAVDDDPLCEATLDGSSEIGAAVSAPTMRRVAEFEPRQALYKKLKDYDIEG